MRKTIPLLLATLLLGACNSYNLRYKADPQPNGNNFFADYVTLQDSVAVQVDTNGLRLEEIYIKKSDGTQVRPMNISYPSFGRAATIGTGIGFGAGPVGIGTGVAVPVGPAQARGLTTATFSAAAIGTAPWQLHVKVEGVQEAIVPQLGGTPNAK